MDDDTPLEEEGMAAEIQPYPADRARRKTLYFAIAAGVATAILSNAFLQLSEGIMAHATTEDLLAVSEECEKELLRMQAQLALAETARVAADTRLTEANTQLAEMVQAHITQDVKDTENIKTNIEWIRRGVDRLMEGNALKPQYGGKP